MTAVAQVLADLPDWLDLDFTRTAAAVLAIVAVVLLLAIVFTVRSIGMKIAAIVLLGGAVFGLLHYRQTLDNCDKNGCACELLGEDLKGGGCTPAP